MISGIEKVLTTSSQEESPAMPMGIVHVATQFQVIIGRPSNDGTQMPTGKIDGQITAFTEEAWLDAFRQARKAVEDMAAKV